ncbi:MAG: phosphoribosyltransferase family protein, partial [Pseudomonadota bacterium]
VTEGRPTLSYEPMLVRRRRATPPQGSPKAPSRRVNIRGAFEVTKPTAVAGAHILIIDDVMTTGATVGELAKTLKRAGAARVDVVTVTRVSLTQ